MVLFVCNGFFQFRDFILFLSWFPLPFPSCCVTLLLLSVYIHISLSLSIASFIFYQLFSTSDPQVSLRDCLGFVFGVPVSVLSVALPGELPDPNLEPSLCTTNLLPLGPHNLFFLLKSVTRNGSDQLKKCKWLIEFGALLFPKVQVQGL